MGFEPAHIPKTLVAIGEQTERLGFDMPSDLRTGALLRSLAATKPGGRLLELGTGTGLATAMLLDGMDAGARLLSVDNDPTCQSVARDVLSSDGRVEFILGDGAAFLASQAYETFDMIFADTWPGKYDGLDDALRLVVPGGLYVVDDMLPQPNWPAEHPPKVDALLDRMANLPGWITLPMDWATGLVIAVRK